MQVENQRDVYQSKAFGLKREKRERANFANGFQE